MTLKNRIKLIILKHRISTLYDRIADLDRGSEALWRRSRELESESRQLLIEAQSLKRDIDNLESGKVLSFEQAKKNFGQTKSNKPDAPYKLEK